MSAIFEDSTGFPRAELPRRLLVTAACVLVYRAGENILLPGINRNVLSSLLGGRIPTGQFTGSVLSIFALGIMPFVNARGVYLLVRLGSSRFRKWENEGETSRRTVKFERALALVFALVQGAGIGKFLVSSTGSLPGIVEFGFSPSFFQLTTTATLFLGTAAVIWLARIISKSGIGNGVAVILLVDMLAPFGSLLIRGAGPADFSPMVLVVVALLVLGMLVLIWRFEGARARLPTTIPGKFIQLRVHEFDERPLIIGSSLLSLPMVVSPWLPALRGFDDALRSSRVGYNCVFALGVVLVALACASASRQPEDIAEGMERRGEKLLGISSEMSVAEFLRKRLLRLAVPNGLYLFAIAFMPNYVLNSFHLNIPLLGTLMFLLVGVAQGALAEPSENAPAAITAAG